MPTCFIRCSKRAKIDLEFDVKISFNKILLFKNICRIYENSVDKKELRLRDKIFGVACCVE